MTIINNNFQKKDFHKIWRLFICAEGLVPYFFLSGSTNQCRQSLWNVLLWLLHPTTMHEKNSNDFWFKISIICHKKKNLFFSLSLSHLWPTRLRVIYYIQQLILVQNSSSQFSRFAYLSIILIGLFLNRCLCLRQEHSLSKHHNMTTCVLWWRIGTRQKCMHWKIRFH